MFGIFGARVPGISPKELEQRLDQADAPLVLDVREPGEYAGGHIPGSRSIPLGSLPGRMREIPSDRAIVVVCLSGGRSAAACKQLLAAGYPGENLTGGMIGWRGPVER